MPTCQISLGRGKRLGRVSFNCRRSDARWIIFSAAHACRACYGARVFQKRRTRTLGGYVITLVYQRPCTILAFRYRAGGGGITESRRLMFPSCHRSLIPREHGVCLGLHPVITRNRNRSDVRDRRREHDTRVLNEIPWYPTIYIARCIDIALSEARPRGWRWNEWVWIVTCNYDFVSFYCVLAATGLIYYWIFFKNNEN